MDNSKTTSTWNSGVEQGTHVFHIRGYSQHRSITAGGKMKSILSSTFPVGGLQWTVFLRPDADESNSDDEIAAGLVLTTKHVAKVRASYDLRLVDQSTGLMVSLHKEAPRKFHFDEKDPGSFISRFTEKRSLFESPTYLQDDCLTMECTVTVFREPWRTKTKTFPKMEVPQSDMAGHYANLLEEKVGVDVTFSVGGEEFTAHKVVLATRSPVFKAQLYGPLREAVTSPITIEDMQPDVFRELLNFIYMDSLPPLDYLKADDHTDMIRHLLVAADRYGMERMSLMCQSILCENLSLQTVPTTFALADQHHCDMLKDACLEFITCSTTMDAVKRTQGYKKLRRTCPPDNSKTMSTWNSGVEQGTHVFDIRGYSHHRSSAAGGRMKNILSGTFPVGGHQWTVFLRPDGFNSHDEIAAGLLLTTKHVAKVRASYDLRLVEQSTGLSVSVHKEAPGVFHFNEKHPGSFISRFTEKRSLFESPTYLQDDCLTMECTVTVIKEPWKTETKPFPKIQVPQSDMAGQCAKLLEEKVGVDVTFSVGGEEFTAHKVVLATRSPVFKAQFYGPLREAGTECITIEDMQPVVFKELLNFIYTDSLPSLDYLNADGRTDMICHLLVAADRYGMERLSLMCQSILCENLSVQTVATTFALADQHQCDMLKDACLEFISCSTAIDAVKRTQGYMNLKRTCPPDVIEGFEKASKFRKA
ncbi:unnamed protein product [Urochloa humidicola]